MITVSVVLVSRNQDWNLRRLIDSVLSKASPFLAIEAILVDGSTTENSLDIACGYRINVIRLERDQQVSPAAARYVGSQHATGTFVLFLDGDMQLADGWLEQALDTLVSDPTIAVVSGKVIEKPKVILASEPKALQQKQSLLVDAEDYGSAALYRRSVLQRVGTFNPYLLSGEGIDLCNRIRRKGHKVVILEQPLATRYREDLQPPSKADLSLGEHMIQLLRRNILLPIALSSGMNVAQWFRSGRPHWWSLGIATVLSLIALDAYSKQRLNRTLRELARSLIKTDGTLRVFPLQVLFSNDTSPIKFEAVKLVGVTHYSFEREIPS